jgi:hypothetical protein
VAVNTTEITLNVKDLPEVLSKLRQEMANMLRDHAETESVVVAQRLRQIADAFEGASNE